MEPISVTAGAFQVVDIKIRTTHRIEAVPQTARIPPLWQRFVVDDVASAIPDRLPESDVIAVYYDYESDDKGPYSFLIGCKVHSPPQQPTPGVLVTGGRYLRFSPQDVKLSTLTEAWKEIRQYFQRSHEFERAFTTDFEIHRPDEAEIYVAVK